MFTAWNIGGFDSPQYHSHRVSQCWFLLGRKWKVLWPNFIVEIYLKYRALVIWFWCCITLQIHMFLFHCPYLFVACSSAYCVINLIYSAVKYSLSNRNSSSVDTLLSSKVSCRVRQHQFTKDESTHFSTEIWYYLFSIVSIKMKTEFKSPINLELLFSGMDQINEK